MTDSEWTEAELNDPLFVICRAQARKIRDLERLLADAGLPAALPRMVEVVDAVRAHAETCENLNCPMCLALAALDRAVVLLAGVTSSASQSAPSSGDQQGA